LKRHVALNVFVLLLKKTSKEVFEKNRSGDYTIVEGQTNFPVNFMKKMLAQYKTPRKIDDGPELPLDNTKRLWWL